MLDNSFVNNQIAVGSVEEAEERPMIQQTRVDLKGGSHDCVVRVLPYSQQPKTKEREK